jgi:uncharacterized membrane protein
MNGDTPQPQKDEKDMTAIFSYLGILLLIPLLAAKDNAFDQYHAKQGLVLFIAEIITVMIAWIPIIGWIGAPILWIIWFVLAIIGIMNVVKGKKEPLPLIGKFASKFNF